MRTGTMGVCQQVHLMEQRKWQEQDPKMWEQFPELDSREGGIEKEERAEDRI